mmetsp:Transcript_4708/g.7026  ORF Transcript_4708/g.7026 Transcript_4708/m.7026 type:complete len:474 (-) Transcript_4708:541-1962(-)
MLSVDESNGSPTEITQASMMPHKKRIALVAFAVTLFVVSVVSFPGNMTFGEQREINLKKTKSSKTKSSKKTKSSSSSSSTAAKRDPLDIEGLHARLTARGLEHHSIKPEEMKRGMFGDFKIKHRKPYKDGSLEHERRYGQWNYNLRKIDALNGVQDRVTYGITAATDFSWSEYNEYANLHFNKFALDVHSGREDGSSKEAQKRGYKSYASVKDAKWGKSSKSSKSKNKRRLLAEEEEMSEDGHRQLTSSSLPTKFDWRDHGMVTSVRAQGMCGDCWAIAATEDIEGTWALSQGLSKATRLSEQQIAACDTDAAGCQGGILSSAYEYVIKAGGMVEESDLPYSQAAFDGKMPSCPNGLTSGNNVDAKIGGWTQIKPMSIGELKEQLMSKGPLALALNSYQMQFYAGGVDTASFCDTGAPDHAVLLVGWGVEGNGMGYWIIKNSWGEHWGVDGYYHLAMGNGACGMYTMITTSLP